MTSVNNGASTAGATGAKAQNASWPDGYGRQVFDSVDSTLSEAARQASELTGSTWILAQEQTAARGRRGRSWATPRGNFA
ncbi:MAG: biotin--[acetyl-CoA-carboxylase] ligase, partial [Roseobacter sp.]|nr:biotin--[acetyl-CoA-carboxylase] ligase [Roseobacter sp.]